MNSPSSSTQQAQNEGNNVCSVTTELHAFSLAGVSCLRTVYV